MKSLIAFVLIAYLLTTVGFNASSSTGVVLNAPPGYTVSNVDPLLNSNLRDEVYDPNFIPGFSAGIPNLSISWQSGNGYGSIGYSIGPWSQPSEVPHMTVGPQCCNFAEVPHTQQFRQPSWGDYYFVKSGLTSPGVNVENYTSLLGQPPSYVGLRTDWNWTVEFSINWTEPSFFNQTNQWAAFGIAATQYVPNASGKLVYTLVNFWMNPQSEAGLTTSSDGVDRQISPPNLVTYHPIQLTAAGNQTITINLTWFLEDTLRSLGLSSAGPQPPVISYVYLNVEGYNFKWNGTIFSFFVMTPSTGFDLSQAAPVIVTVAVLLAAFTSFLYLRSRRRTLRSPKAQPTRLRPST